MKRLQLDIPLMDKPTLTPTPQVQYHPTGNAFIENNVALVSPQYDADVKTGRALALGATNDLAIPIHNNGGTGSFLTYHDIANDEIIQIDNSLNPPTTEYILNDVTVNNILTHKMAFSAGDLTLLQQEPNLLAALAMGEATPISSVTLDADDSWYACSEVSGAYVVDQRSVSAELVTNGEFKIDLTDWSDTLALWEDGTMKVWLGAIADAPRQDITLSASTEFTISFLRENTIDFGLWNAVQIRKVSNGDIVYTSNPVFGTATNGYFIESFTTTTETEYYILCMVGSGAETLSKYMNVDNISIVENKDYSEIAGDITNIRLTNQQKGLQTTALLLDGAGVPESYNNTPNTARVYDDTIISTGFKPSIVRYSIEESVSGNLADLDVNGDPTGSFTERTEARVLTYTANLIGPEIFAGAALDTQADFDEFTVNTSGQYSFDEPSGEVSHNAPGFETYLYAPITGLVIDATYEVSSDATIVAGNPHYIMNGVDVAGVDLGETGRFVATQTQGNFGVHCISGTGIFTFRTLSIKRVTAEDKYYIGTDGGAMVEQAVVPPLPDPNTTINLGNVAVIGYTDTIESREADFNVHSEVITP